jgi:hypothetical protein
MAYQTGTANNMEDLLNALQVFAAAQGWTIDAFNTTNDWLYLNNGSVYVGFRYDNAASGGGIAMFQGLGYAAAGGAVSATIGAGGTGYANGQVLTVSGGTSLGAARFTITGSSGGVVTSVSLLDIGGYSATPGNPAATTVSPAGGTGCTLNVTYGAFPGNFFGDSGVGLPDSTAPFNAAVSSARRITITNGPYTSYHFFTDGTTKYIHVVVEYSPGLYRHFGFGTIDKLNNWTGGEYAYAHRWSTGANSDNPISQGSSTNPGGHNVMFDIGGGSTTLSDANEAGCTMHVEGLTGQAAGSKWGLFISQTTGIGNDRQGQARINLRGGSRGGGHVAQLGFMRANILNGYIPLIPIPIWWITGSSPVQTMLLGYAPDIRICNIGNINPGQEFTVGPDTWKVFPWTRKQFLQADTEESWNGGWAYRKVP